METTVKVNGWQAFRSGLARSARYPQILLAAYLVNLLTAALLLVLPALSLIGPAHYTAIQAAANGLDAWLVEEIGAMFITASILNPTAAGLPAGLQQGLLIASVTLLAIPLLAWLPASFLGGGVLLTLVEAPQAFSWRRFFWGSWHWFGAFLLANGLMGMITTLLISGLMTGIIAAMSAAGMWINWITLPVSMLIVVPWLAISEYTRLIAVADQTRNIFKTFGRAVVLVFRRPLALMGFYGLSLALLAVIHLLFRWLLLNLPLDWWPLIFIVTQAFILARLWTRMARWAGMSEIR